MRRLLLVALVSTAGCDTCGKSSAPPAAAVDAGPPAPFCKQQKPAPQACDDFDDPSFDLGTRVVRGDDGDAKLVAGERSKQEAVSFATVPSAADAGSHVFYFLDAAPPPNVSGAWMMSTAMLDHDAAEGRVAFDLKIGQLTGNVTLARISAGSWYAALEADPKGARLVESYMEPDAKPRAMPLEKALPRGAWGSVAIVLVVGKTLTVTVDGAKAAEAPPLPLKYRARSIEGIVGVRQDGETTANDAAFDDVIVDVK